MKYTINKNFKTREEKNGTYSFMNLETMQIMFLNKTASIIYNNADIDILDDLVVFIMNNFKGVTFDEAKKDCEQILNYMDVLGLINIVRESSCVEQITVAGENDYKDISQFILDSLCLKDVYMLLSSNKKTDYSAYAIRNRQFNDLEYNFIHRDHNNKIDALLTFSYNKGSSILTLTNIVGEFKNETIFSEIIQYVLEQTMFLTKIRFLIEDNKINNIKNLIEKLGFTIETKLKKEYDNNDLLIYSIIK